MIGSGFYLRRFLATSILVGVAICPTKSPSQTASVPTIIVGKSLSRFLKDADSNRLSRALLLNQFLAQGARPNPYVYSPIIIAPQESVPFGPGAAYQRYGSPPPVYSHARPGDLSALQVPVPNLSMRVKIESTEPRWNLALEIYNANPFPVPLNFISSQRFNFVLEVQETGQTIWESAAAAVPKEERSTLWLNKGETKKFSASVDPNSVKIPEKQPLVLKGILNTFSTPLSVQAYVIYQEKEK
jgi:hypothetical protein